MGYVEKSLSDGEEVLEKFKYHWIVKIPIIIEFISIILIPLALFAALSIRFVEHGLTNKRVIFKKGIIGRKTQEMRIDSIETVEIQQGVLARILGYGTVSITG